MTTAEVPQHEETTERDAPRTRRHDGGSRVVLVLAIAIALAVGFGAGWLAVADGGESDDGTATGSAPPEVLDVVDRFLAAYETNDYELLDQLVTDQFRRPFYVGDSSGSPWRDVFGIDAYAFMDDPNLSESELTSYEIEAVGERIVRGNGPWVVAEPQNWHEDGRPTQLTSIQTFVVVEVDGDYLVDDAYWAGMSELVPEDE